MRILIAALMLAGCSASAQDDANVMNVLENAAGGVFEEETASTPVVAQPTRLPRDRGTTDIAKIMQEIRDTPRPPSVHEVIDLHLPRFRGKSPQYAFDRLGYPDRKMVIGNATIYSWISTDTNVDGSALACTVKVVVRAAKIINTEHDGNAGACARYAYKLDPKFIGRY